MKLSDGRKISRFFVGRKEFCFWLLLLLLLLSLVRYRSLLVVGVVGWVIRIILG
jgi:hypothetical protein